MTDTTITIVGNLTADPELRYTQSGVAVASLTIASTPRRFDKTKGEYVDGETLFMRCNVWREFAEHVAGSLTKGMRVVAQGQLRQRSYQDREGQSRSSIELEVDEIGPSLKYATAQVTRAARPGGGQAAAVGAGAGQAGSWVTPTENGAQAGAQGFDSDVPF